MSEKTDLTLNEIRNAYRKILQAYNALFPVNLPLIQDREDDKQGIKGRDEGLDTSYLKTRLSEMSPKLRRAADQSGNAQIWHRGEALDRLSGGMKGRIKAALRFGL